MTSSRRKRDETNPEINPARYDALLEGAPDELCQTLVPIADMRAAARWLEHGDNDLPKRLLPGEARVLRNLLKTAVPRTAGDAGGRGRG